MRRRLRPPRETRVTLRVAIGAALVLGWGAYLGVMAFVLWRILSEVLWRILSEMRRPSSRTTRSAQTPRGPWSASCFGWPLNGRAASADDACVLQVCIGSIVALQRKQMVGLLRWRTCPTVQGTLSLRFAAGTA